MDDTDQTKTPLGVNGPLDMNEGPLDVKPFEVYLDHAIADHDLICELAKHSGVLYGLFVDIVRQFYMNGRGYIKGCPDCRFDYDRNRTGIWIDKEMRWEDEHPEFRPAIYVKLDPLKFEYPTGYRGFVVEKHTSTAYDLRKVSGTVSFVHMARTAGEANVLCDNTLNYLRVFADVIRQDYCMSLFRPVSQTPITKAPQASSDQWMSVGTCAYEFVDSSGVRPEAPVLQEVSVRALQDRTPSGILRTDLHNPRQGKGV